jgi:hypothetical protein
MEKHPLSTTPILTPNAARALAARQCQVLGRAISRLAETRLAS